MSSALSDLKRKRREDDPNTSSKMSRLAMPKLKIFHWSEYTPPPGADRVCIRDASMTVSDKCIFKNDRDTLTHHGYVSVEAWVETAGSSDECNLTQSFFLDPPTVPLPSVLIRIELNLGTEDKDNQYLIVIIPLSSVGDILCDETTMVDSSAALRRLATRLLQSTLVRQSLRPCLDEFGISMTALTPYTLVY